jgi:hypothetical protein
MQFTEARIRGMHSRVLALSAMRTGWNPAVRRPLFNFAAIVSAAGGSGDLPAFFLPHG